MIDGCEEKIFRILSKVIKSGGKKFIIYPFGKYGRLTQSILNDRFKICEEMIIDNNINMQGVYSVKVLEHYTLADDEYILFTGRNWNVCCEMIKELKMCIPENKIISFFSDELALYNVNHSDFTKNALLVYLTIPFKTEAKTEPHQNWWQIKEIARLLENFGYNVDVIDYYNEISRLEGGYDLVIDITSGANPTYSECIDDDTVRIAYLTGGNPAFSNAAEKERLHNLFLRRNVELSPRRQAKVIPKEIEIFDAVFCIGNRYTLKTYKEFTLPPVFFIRNHGYDFGDIFCLEGKKTTNFLFFGSAGQVHKGLDLLLEIFSEKNFPYDLYICSSFENEKDFVNAYYKELYKTENIHAVGWVDIYGKEFQHIVNRCTYGVFPSCSEARCGSVLTVMSAGIIPICSRECGLDDDEVMILEDCSLNTIRKTISYYAEKDIEWVGTTSNRMVEIVRTRYTRETFTKSIQEAFEKCLMG